MIEIVNLTDEETLKNFIEVHNKAFSSRKDHRNPYTPINIESFKNNLGKNEQLFVIKETDQVIGGLGIKYVEQKLKICEVAHVCIDPEQWGKGLAYKLLDYIHQKAAEDGCQIARLSVGAVWKNAIGLYHKCGYREIGIGAHVPGTYPLLTLIKPLPPYSYPAMKRKWKYFIAKLKFGCLYKKDSSPKWLCKVLFK